MPYNDEQGKNDLNNLDRHRFRPGANVYGDNNGGNDAGQRDDPGQDDHDQENDQREKKIRRTAAGESKQAKEIAVHGSYRFSALETGVEREAVADSGCQSTRCCHCIISSDQPGKQNDKGYLQKVQSHGCEPRLFA